jgi:hypothetical protein
MAGDWIKMRTNLDSDVRVIELASMLGLPELHVVGCLWKLWAWADMHTHDGNAIRVTGVTLDRFTGVDGFAEALRKVGWLEGRDNALSFPRFAEHNGQTAKNRAETKQRVAKHRNAKAVTDVTGNTLPEKRREERDTTTRGISIVRPSIEEVASYCRERGNHVDPQAWLDHYSANGWRVGRNPMKDWKAAVRQWERNDLGRSKPAAQGKPVTFAQQRQQNVLDLIAKLEAQDAQSGTQLLEATR